MLRNAEGVGWGHQLSQKKCCEGVQFNVISVTRGWAGINFPGKKHYVTLEWGHTDNCKCFTCINICVIYGSPDMNVKRM